MGIFDDLADALAKDTIEAAEKLGEPKLIHDVAEQLQALSSTSHEAYMTSVRIRLSEARARKYLERRLAEAARKAADPEG